MKENKKDNFINRKIFLNRDKFQFKIKIIKFENYITNKSNTIRFIYS